MKIVQITPGSGDSFYCENCLRDLAIVRGLRQAGHEALTVPLYLPLLGQFAASTDVAPIFFGGVNVYLQQKSALFRRTPRWIDRLFDARWLLRWAAGKTDMTDPATLGQATLSMLRGEEGRQKKELARLVEWMIANHRPDVVSLSNAMLVGMARRLRKELGTRIVCWLQDEDEFLDDLPQPYRDQSWQTIAERAADVDAFIGTSRFYADYMQQRLNLPAEKFHVVHEAVDWAPYAPADAPPETPTIGFFSRMYPAKGLDLLVEAMILLKASGKHPSLKLRAGGGQTAADEPYIQAIRDRIAAAGLADDVEFVPNYQADERREFLRNLTVMCVPERRAGAAGLYVLESLAVGVPVVQPNHGVYPELIAATGGGELFAPGDAKALAAAMDAVLSNPRAARKMGQAARSVVLSRFSLNLAVDKLVEIFRKIVV